MTSSSFTHGPLGSQSTFSSVLRPKRGRVMRPMMFTLALTSLIDAFSILVIFLLIQGPSGHKEINLGDVKLPSVQKFTTLDEGITIRIEKGVYYINDTQLDPKNLVSALHEARQSLDSTTKSLIVQADRRSEFNAINPIIQAGAQTGFEQIKFAVMPQKGS